MEQAIVARSRTGWNSAEEALLLEAVDRCRSAGESVRACTLRIAQGDTRRMLRYQNKYRALLKNRPALVDQARRELAETGSPVFDPYAPSPAGPGRPRKAAAERDTDALIRTLCESLMELLRRTEQIQK